MKTHFYIFIPFFFLSCGAEELASSEAIMNDSKVFTDTSRYIPRFQGVAERNQHLWQYLEPNFTSSLTSTNKGVKVTLDTSWNMKILLDDTILNHSQLVLERFRWQKYIPLDTLTSAETWIQNIDLHAGLNTFYLTDKDRLVAFFAIDGVAENYLWSKCFKARMILERSSDFEIYNDSGKLVLQGNTLVFDLDTLPKGLYYLDYDNSNREFQARGIKQLIE